MSPKSPIDIVPVQENAYVLDMESSMDIVPNHQIYHSERTDSTIFSNISALPLVPQQQTSRQNVKHSHVSGNFSWRCCVGGLVQYHDALMSLAPLHGQCWVSAMHPALQGRLYRCIVTNSHSTS